MRGVDIENFFAAHQEMDDTFETASLGYRGLSGPPSRRPSNLVARLYERMSRKSSSGPQTCSSFENPPPAMESLTLKLPEVPVDAEETALTPTNQSISFHPLLESASSSRRSSLRRQECLDLPDTAEEEQPEEIPESGSFNRSLLANVLPTVYVTPPPSTIFSQASLDLPESVTTHEVILFLHPHTL